MKRFYGPPTIAAVSIMLGVLSACSLNPNVRKLSYFRSGQQFFAAGRYSAAASEFSKAVKIDPNYADAHFQLAESYMRMQQPDRACQEFRRTVDLAPSDFRARISMTNLLIITGDLADAGEQTDILRKQRPDDPAVHSAIASLLARKGDVAGAIRETERTISLAPGRWEPYLSLALLQRKNGDAAMAESSFKKVLVLDPKQPQPRIVLGQFYQSRGRLADAEQQFRIAMAIAPGDMAPRQALAALYLMENETKEAEDVLLQANRNLPTNPDSLLALSDLYYSIGNVDKAVSEYAALYRERPHDLIVKKKFIQLLIQTKHDDQANKLNSEILSADPNDSDALVYRSEIQIGEGAVDKAAQTLQTVVRNSPNHVEAHYALGIALERQGHPERAQSEFRKALSLNPNDLGAERSLADVAIEKGDMNALGDASSQMIRLAPGSPRGYALRAFANIHRGQLDAAALDVQKAIAVAPQSDLGYLQLGNLHFVQKQYGDAAKAFQNALFRNSGSADALRNLMKTYFAEHQPDKAIAAARAQIQKAPGNSAFYDLLGAGLFHFVKDLNGAEAAFEKSIALGKNTDAVIQLCQVLAEKGETDQAIAAAQRALSKHPRQAAIDLVLGDLYASRSDWKDAQAAYRNAVTISPNNAVAANDLAGAILHTGGDLNSAMSLVRRAQKLAPGSPAIVGTLGWIYYRRGEYAMAVASLQEALNLKGAHQMDDEAVIQFRLGMAYEKMQQASRARQHFERALQADPSRAEAIEIEAELSKLKS